VPASPSLGARLQRKVGPLPVWGWAAVILGAFLAYTRLSKSSSAASTDSTGVTSNDGTTGSDAQQPASGGGTAADNLSGDLLAGLDANTSAIDSLTSQILSMPTPYSNVGDGPLAGAPAADPAQSGGDTSAPASQPTASQPATSAQVGGNVHETQTAAGVLHWGGVTFTDKASFDRWARAHGTTTAKELSSHPQARSIYSTLR
jgi:hypothetical protein